MTRRRSTTRIVIVILAAFLAAAVSADNGAELDLAAGDRILVLAPHPDDEVLGCGGVIQRALALGIPLRVVFFTYGDNNELAFLLHKKRPVILPSAVRAMGEVRGREALAAADLLGVPRTNLVFLGYPDFGTLRIWYYHWRPEKPYLSMLTRTDQVRYPDALRPGALHLGDSILEDIETLLRDFRPSRIFLPHPSDTNPDHAALYLYTRVAQWNLAPAPEPVLHSFLVHFPGWPVPRGYHPDESLHPPVRLASQPGWLAFALTPDARARKEQALRAHATQFAYSSDYLRSFVRANELFGLLPDVRLRPAETSPADWAALLAGSAVLLPDAQGAPAAEADLPAPGPDEHLLDAGPLESEAGAELQSVARRGNTLVLTIRFSRPLVGLVHARVHLFGYRPNVPFGDMPKLRVQVGTIGSLVYDRFRRVPAPDVLVSRRSRRITVQVPLRRLGDPDRVLISMRTMLGDSDLDWSCWRVVHLAP
jgi:LmbE family N-acetylglucosaminyl deacetylase